MIDRTFHKDPESDLYGVIGSPVSHSLSPLIHNTAFAALGINARYGAFDVPPCDLSKSITEAKAARFKGLNVTVPHKQNVMSWLDEMDPTAQAIGAVNTIAIREGRTIGYNTDALGFAGSLTSLAGRLQGTYALVLGAGGAAHAVVDALSHKLDDAKVFIVNRNQEKAKRLAGGYRKAVASNISTIDPESLTLIVNATSLGLRFKESPVSPEIFRQQHIAYDLIYDPPMTQFLSDARSRGAMTINGLGMLIGQASAAFRIWTGQQMPVDEVYRKLQPAEPFNGVR